MDGLVGAGREVECGQRSVSKCVILYKAHIMIGQIPKYTLLTLARELIPLSHTPCQAYLDDIVNLVPTPPLLPCLAYLDDV